MSQYTKQQIAAIQAASVLIDEAAVEIPKHIRNKTPIGDKNVVTGKKGRYEYIVVDGKPIGKLYYCSSYSLKQATAEKQVVVQNNYNDRRFDNRSARYQNNRQNEQSSARQNRNGYRGQTDTRLPDQAAQPSTAQQPTRRRLSQVSGPIGRFGQEDNQY